MMFPLVVGLAIGVAGSASAATLDFTGTLAINIFQFRDLDFTSPPPYTGPLVFHTVPGAGSAQITDDGSLHLLSFSMLSGAFGPSTVTYIWPSWATPFNSNRFTLSQNLSGSFTGISGGSPGGGLMGLSGIAKICGWWGMPGCDLAQVPLPLTPTTGGAGFGIGGTATYPGAVAVTMQHMAWTLGQPVMTLHTPNSTFSIPVLPGGFAHGPASLTSSTAQLGGAVQLVTVSKVYTSLQGAFPEVPLTAVLTLHFVPEPGTLLLLFSGVAGIAVLGWRRRIR